MKLKGAEIIMETLISQGTDTIFGYPGGTVIDFYDALYKYRDRLNHILTSHEQGACHAADGYARHSGKTGVVFATSGPGASNLVTGIATAFLDSTPLVAITGNVAKALIGRDSFQEIDIAGITMPITKHNYRVRDINQLEDILNEAFMLAGSGRPGPVLVDVPKDIQLALCEYKGIDTSVKPSVTKVDADKMEQAIAMITEAKRPFIYCGGGVVNGDASEELITLSERLDIPVGFSLMGLSAMPYNHRNFLGMAGMHGRYAATKAMTDSDLIIAVGARFSDRATGNKEAYSKNKNIIHIDVDPAEIGKNIPVQLDLLGDIGEIMKTLTEHFPKQENKEWQDEISAMRAAEKENAQVYNGLSPKDVIQTANRVLGDDIIVTTDVGQHQMWTAQYYPLSKPRSFITSGGLGTMGFGMGAAMGACMAGDRKRTLLFTGDGSFHMNLNEMATAVTNELPLTIVVLNNSVLGMVRQWQTLFYDKRYSNTTLQRKTDFVKLAESFGAQGMKVTSSDQLEGAYKEAANHKGPFLIECTIDPDELVLPMIPPGGTMENIVLH